MKHALISNIQRFSLDDGPGIRTTVFFKGCSLACKWCHNPECISFTPELQLDDKLCVRCGACIGACPHNAHKVSKTKHVIARNICKNCGECVSACRKKALKLVGDCYETDALVKEIFKDKAYFKSSGGGVTFSGGEPALFSSAIIPVALQCKEAGFTTALDTAGNVSFSHYEQLLPVIDVFLYDVKCYTAAKHQDWVGADNEQILNNLRSLDEKAANYIIRVPVIPGFNDTITEHSHIAKFLSSLKNIKLIQLLPYHNMGSGKYEKLGLTYPMGDCKIPRKIVMQSLLKKYLEKNLQAQIP